MKTERKIHFSGGVRTPTVQLLPGYPCCSTGDRAHRVVESGRCTADVDDVTCFRCLNIIDQAIGGPPTCSRECSECTPKGRGFFSAHHFADIVETVEDKPDHPAKTIFSRDAWYRCKHCVAWALDETAASI